MKFTLRTQAAAAMLVLAPLGAALVAQPAAAQVYSPIPEAGEVQFIVLPCCARVEICEESFESAVGQPPGPGGDVRVEQAAYLVP